MIWIWTTFVILMGMPLLVRGLTRGRGVDQVDPVRTRPSPPRCPHRPTPVPVVVQYEPGVDTVVAHLCPDCREVVRPQPVPPKGPGGISPQVLEDRDSAAVLTPVVIKASPVGTTRHVVECDGHGCIGCTFDAFTGLVTRMEGTHRTLDGKPVVMVRRYTLAALRHMIEEGP